MSFLNIIQQHNSGFAWVCASSASKFGVETKTIAADFGSLDIYPEIENRLKGLEIGILGKTLLNSWRGADIHHQVTRVQVRNERGSDDWFTTLLWICPCFPSSLLPSEDWKLNNMLSSSILKKQRNVLLPFLLPTTIMMYCQFFHGPFFLPLQLTMLESPMCTLNSSLMSKTWTL